MANEQVEDRIREQWARGSLESLESAVEIALKEYGPEVYGYLVKALGSRDDADDVFSMFSIDLYHSLSKFRGQCSFRGWAYMLAQHAKSQFRRGACRQVATVPLSRAEQLSAIQAEVRSRSAIWLQSDFKQRFQQMCRDILNEQEQEILTLRVGRGMDWKDIARILLAGQVTDDAHGKDDVSAIEADEHTVTREAARVRTAFMRLKRKLYEKAQERGMVSGDEADDFRGKRGDR